MKELKVKVYDRNLSTYVTISLVRCHKYVTSMSQEDKWIRLKNANGMKVTMTYIGREGSHYLCHYDDAS